LIYKGTHGQLTPSDLLNASEDALTGALGIDVPDTAKYVLNEYILPTIFDGPQIVTPSQGKHTGGK